MKKIVVSVFILLCAVSSVQGQYYRDRTKTPEKKIQPVTKTTKAKKIGPDYDQFYYFLFDVNQPVSNKDFIGNSSSFGSKLGYRKKIDDEGRLWGGVEFGYAVYKQHIPYQAYQYGSTAISAELFNYSINTSLTGNLD